MGRHDGGQPARLPSWRQTWQDAWVYQAALTAWEARAWWRWTALGAALTGIGLTVAYPAQWLGLVLAVTGAVVLVGEAVFWPILHHPVTPETDYGNQSTHREGPTP